MPIAQSTPSGSGPDTWRRRRLLRTTAGLGALTYVLSVLAIVSPTVAAAQGTDPTVDAAVAQLSDLGLTQLTAMPSSRTTYRTYADFNNEMQALASANPGFVAIKTAPYRSVEGREIKYLEITNNVNAQDGKPVYFAMASIHGIETPSGEEALEFLYDVVQTAKTNPPCGRCSTVSG